MTKEALKLALEALEGYESCIDGYYADAVCPQIDKAITAIKEALAQPEQEPVADHFDCGTYLGSHIGKEIKHRIENYSPPQRTWVRLTDEEREEIALEVPIDAVSITEAKLKEKNA